jgi:hypothetical protein
MKTIKLTNLKIELLDGTFQEADLSKSLAELIFKTTQEIREHCVAIDLYRKGEVENTPENIEILRENMKKFCLASAQIAFERYIEENVKSEKL